VLCGRGLGTVLRVLYTGLLTMPHEPGTFGAVPHRKKPRRTKRRRGFSVPCCDWNLCDDGGPGPSHSPLRVPRRTPLST